MKLLPPIEKLNILDNNQHGFRTGRSCTTALTVFSQNVFNELDKPNQFVVVAFIDLRKGFDSISHYHLLKMLREFYKINAKLLLLICNYLRNRHYYIKIGVFISRAFVVNRGIGQGFVNGPVLFFLFVNDIATVLTDCFYTLFADDASVQISGSDINVIINEMSDKLCNLNNWLESKGLSMNKEKTKYMVIRKRPNCTTFENLPPILINGVEIERVSSYKYLGVVVDEFFSFKAHSESVQKRVSINIGLLSRLRRHLTRHMLTVLLNAYVNAVTDYCLTIWGPSRVGDFTRIQAKVNQLLATYCYPKLAKYYTKTYWKCQFDNTTVANARASCKKSHAGINYDDLLEKFNLLSIKERLEYYAIWNLFKIKKYGTNVNEFDNMYTLNETGHRTRSSQKMHIITHSSVIFTNSVRYYSIKLWNTLDAQMLHELFSENIHISGNVRSRITEFVMKKRTSNFV